MNISNRRMRREAKAPTVLALARLLAPCCVDKLGPLRGGPFIGVELEAQANAMLWLFQIPSWPELRPFIMACIETQGLASEAAVNAANEQNWMGDRYLTTLRARWVEGESTPAKIADVIDRCGDGRLPVRALGDLTCVMVRGAGDFFEQHHRADTKIGRAYLSRAHAMDLLSMAVLTGFKLAQDGSAKQDIAFHALFHIIARTLVAERWVAIPEGVS